MIALSTGDLRYVIANFIKKKGGKKEKMLEQQGVPQPAAEMKK